MRVYYQTVDCSGGLYMTVFVESRECIDILNWQDPERFPDDSYGSFECEGFKEKILTMSEILEEYA